MRPIKILGIAPYEGIASLMQQAAESRDDLQIVVHVGNLTAGAEIAAAQTAQEEYDVILSRGGTAEAIRRCTDLKVVDIPLSVYDILRSIKLAENHNCKYAVIGFPAITRNATFLCEVLRYNVDIYTIHDQKEARTILQGLENSGCQMVLCDVVTNSLAQEYGIPALLITSGIESVEDALNTAVQEGLARRKALELAQFFQDVIRAMPYDTLVSDEAGQDLFVSLSPELPDSVLAKAHSAIMQRTAEPHRSCLEENGIHYALQSTPIQMEGALRHVVTIEKSRLSIPLEKYGIAYSDRQQAVDTFFDSFYGITQSFSTANLTLESKDYDTARAALDAALNDAGGYLESSSEYSDVGSSRSVNLTFRVPEENYQSFLDAVAQAGNVTYKSQQADDVTTQYMDVETRLANLEAQRTRLQELQAQADNLSDLLQIETSLTDVQSQIESWQSQLDWYSNQVQQCTVYVNLNEVQNYTPTDESFLGSVGAAFAQGWSNFVNGLQQLAVWLAGAWPVVLVIAAAAAGFAVWRKKRKK